MFAKYASPTVTALLILLVGVARAQSNLVISEFMAVNSSGLTDLDGDYSDWIEIFNGSTSPVSLAGMYLTDEKSDLDKWPVPSVTLLSGEYLVVFASDKDRRDPGDELHTNFRLSGGGEYLGLVDTDGFTVVHAYDPAFPDQFDEASYGVSAGAMHELRYFATPTPGSANGGDYIGLVADTKFSPDRGFYTNSVAVVITTETPDAEIRYTLDGSEPSPVSGRIYSDPIVLSNSTPVRAVAWRTGWRTTDVDAHTYIFPWRVVEQDGEGLPDTWGHAGADYEMDPDVVGPSPSNVAAALLAIPTVSLALPVESMFGAGGVGIYPAGEGSPRATSLEYVDPSTGQDFQINCSVEVFGGSSVGRWKTDKLQFRLRFKAPYGPTKLKKQLFGPGTADEFDNLVLNGRLANTWTYNGGVSPSVQRSRAQFLRDQYSTDIQNDMEGIGPHGNHVHLYVDGVYWGIYGFHERPDESFASVYYGGDPEDYDVQKANGIPNGDGQDYLAMRALAQAGLSTLEEYGTIQEHVDVAAFIDYICAYFYLAPFDWRDRQNWYATHNRVDPDGRWRYHMWDAEHSLEGINDNVTGAGGTFGPQGLHQALAQNPEYRLRFADHVHRHFYNGGALTPDACAARYHALASVIYPAVPAESARWGDNVVPTVPYTRDEHWMAEQTRLLDTFFPARSAAVLGQIVSRGLYPSIAAPVFSRHGGGFTNSYALSMSASATIQYTTDGTDPREYGTGTPVGTSYGSAVTLTETTLVKARAFDGSTWSALNEAVFTLTTPPTLDVTQIMYNPRDAEGAETNVTSNADAFEFLELRNTGPDTVGLAGLNFSEGIDFDFTEMDDLFLDPGERLLLVRDLDAFAARYDTSGLRIAGEYDGALDNAGERITLVDGIGSNVISLAYDDARGWPQAADGAGHSLVPLAADGLSYGGNWRASAFIDGSPGLADPTPVHDVVLNEFAAHTDYTNAAKPEYDSNDWLELFNTRTNAISLSNFYLSDDPGVLRKWAIPATNTVAGGGYLSFDEVTGFHSPITSGFGLNKAGEALYLSYLPGTAQDRVVDCLRFKGQENGATLGRYPDGADWWYTTVPTRSTTNALAAEHVVINQLMTHPADGTNEYIVLYNPSATPAELWNAVGPYRIDGGVSYDFPSNTMIAARDYATLVPFSPTNSAAVAAFETAYGLPAGQTYLLGPFDGKLDNVGDRVALERPQAPDAEGEGVSWVIVDEVIYSGYSPWPTNVHANGNALQRIDGRHSGNDPSNWVGQPAGLVPAKIFITYPWAGSTLDMPFDVEVVATVDPNQVSGSVQRVDFFLDEVLLGTDATSPYGAAMNYTHVSNITSYTLRADLVDDAGTNRSVEIVFHADHADRVHLVDPLDGLSLVAPFTQLVRAGVDMDHVLGTIDNVSFYSGTNLLYTDPTAPYEFLASDLDLPPTRWHDLTATVLDDFGPTTSRVVSLYSYDSVWSNATYRMKVHFPGYLGDERVQEFPALVTLSEGIPGFSYSQVASPTGADLRFADHTGTNIVVHEIESWDTNGSSIVWVRLPELYSTNTWIWAYWGDPDATLPSYATDGSVWENDYELVMHMAETGGRTARDASTNAYGASFEVWVSYAWQQSGAIGPAVRFGDNFASLLLTPDVPMGTEWTLSAWFKDLAGTAANRILTETASGDSPAIVFSGGNSLGSEDGGPSPCGYELTGSSEWRRLTAVGDDSGTRYFIDGEQVGSISNRVGGSLASIGNMSSGFGTERFARYLDEVRFSSTVRSEDWIAASWLNQASNGVFVTFGPAERQEPSGEPDPDSDNDGMLDAWEDEYLGGTGADPEADPDGDGMRNREEFIAGTDPTNALSLFDLSLQWSGGQLLVVFEAEDAAGYGPGYQRFYSLRGATNLLSPTWVGVGDHTNIPGSGQTVIYTNPAGAAPRTFRGEVWLTD